MIVKKGTSDEIEINSANPPRIKVMTNINDCILRFFEINGQNSKKV